MDTTELKPLTDLKEDNMCEVTTAAAVKDGEDVEEKGILSKRAQKKLLKRQQWLDTKHERRAKEKEKRKRKMEERKKDGTFEESRNTSRKRLKECKMSDSSCKVGVVFDLQFESLMNQRDLGKTLKQIMKCYSFNRRIENPLQLYMTSFQGRVKEDMSKNQGFENWDFNFEAERYDFLAPCCFLLRCVLVSSAPCLDTTLPCRRTGLSTCPASRRTS